MWEWQSEWVREKGMLMRARVHTHHLWLFCFYYICIEDILNANEYATLIFNKVQRNIVVLLPTLDELINISVCWDSSFE